MTISKPPIGTVSFMTYEAPWTFSNYGTAYESGNHGGSESGPIHSRLIHEYPRRVLSVIAVHRPIGFNDGTSYCSRIEE